MENEYGTIVGSMPMHRRCWRISAPVTKAVPKPLALLLTMALTQALTTAPTGCSARNGKGDAPAISSCEASRAHIQSLYSAPLSKDTSDSTKDGEILDELIAANVHMILADCTTDPSRFVSCIQQASSIAQLEAECVIPLDDDGRVEAAQFAVAN